jgi:hypothetical protein
MDGGRLETAGRPQVQSSVGIAAFIPTTTLHVTVLSFQSLTQLQLLVVAVSDLGRRN